MDVWGFEQAESMKEVEEREVVGWKNRMFD
jgi:hypothetical protein